MRREERAPGFTVDWLNAWLAALGVTVLVPDVRLGWTDGAVPFARFFVPGDRPSVAELVAEALPTAEELVQLAIARWRDDRVELSRKVSLAAYADRAELARQSADTSLSSTLTDLLADLPKDGLPHSPFDPSVPKGLTLWQRLVSCRQAIGDVAAATAASFAGRGRRVENNGLGFDVRRLVAGVRAAEKSVDPLVEVLAFFGLAFFPMRGDGAQAQPRGWDGPPSRPGSFRWCAWSPALDRWAIDALLDLATGPRATAAVDARLGITARYRTVPYRWFGSADPTRAFGSQREP